MSRICLSGYYGYGNAGDEAILQAIKEQLSMHNITVLSKDNRFNLKAILDCDIFVSGGGGLFQDATSSRSFLYYLSMLKLAQLFRKKTCVLSQSIGPLNGKRHRKMLAKVLKKVDILSVRDKASVELLRQIGIEESKVIKSADPTFLLESVKRRGDMSHHVERRPFVGVSVREGEFDAKVVAMALDRFKEEYNAEILFIPFQVPQDVATSKKVIALMKHEAGLVTSQHRPMDIMKLIGEMDMFLGMRLHSLIFSCINAVPMIGIPYDPKVSSFLKEIKQPQFSPDRLSYVWDHRKKIKEQLKTSCVHMHTLAKRPFKILY